MLDPLVVSAVDPGRRARAERMRGRLLDAARSALASAGWHGCRVEDICRAAGVGRGTFYGHFANKSAVLEALVRKHAAELDALLEADWTAGDPTDAVRRVIDGFVACSERDAAVRAAWLEAAPGDPALSDLVDEVRRQFVARIESSLASAVAAQRARSDLDVPVAAGALAAMVEQYVALTSGSAATVARDRVVDGLADLWVHAVYR